MLGDASGEFVKAMGLEFTAPPAGLNAGRSGSRSMRGRRGEVLHLEENPGICDVSGGQALADAI